jgi:hypothetical protein
MPRRPASDVSALNVGLVGAGGLPLTDANARLEEPAKGRPKLSGHGAVEDEIDRAVEEGEDIHDLAEAVVAAAEEAVPEECREQAQNALGYLGDEKEQKDGDEHARGAVCPVLRPAQVRQFLAVCRPQQPSTGPRSA